MFVLVPFEAEVLGALGFASQDQDNLLLGSGVISFLRLKISLAFSERFEFLGSWDLRPPGVMSCLPSEGAGSGARPHLLSVPELCRYLAESWLTFQIHLQELLQYKKQNPAQFCARVCSGCAVLAVLGHYVPGIMISYIVCE